MSETQNPETPDDVLAAELVLGLLEPEDRALALRKQLSDPAFAEKVDAWNARMDPLFQEVQPADPSGAVWNGIAAQLDAPSSANTVIALKRWRVGAIASGALAACLALALLVSPANVTAPPDTPTTLAVAQLTGPIEGLVLAVSYNPATAEMRVDVDGMPETETEPEIWIVGQDGISRSLGQIGRDGISKMIVPADHRKLIAADTILTLTMEPPSPEPHSAPSSEPVASGKITFI